MPVIVPITNIKKYDKSDKTYIEFLIYTALFTAIEVAAIVFIPEEGGKIFPSKICFRYMALFMMPYILMFLKLDYKKIEITKKTYIISLIIIIYMLAYNSLAERSIPTIDGYLLVAIQIVDRTWRYSSIILISVLYITIIKIIDVYRKGKIKNLATVFSKVLIIIGLILLPADINIPINASNDLRRGSVMEEEYIKLAKYIKLDYDKVYAYNLRDYNFFGQVISDYKKIGGSDTINIDTTNDKVILIVEKDSESKIAGAHKVDVGLKYLDIYVSNENDNNITIN